MGEIKSNDSNKTGSIIQGGNGEKGTAQEAIQPVDYTTVSYKAKKGLSRLVFSRTALVIILLLVQVILLVTMFRWLSDYATLIQLAFTGIGIVVVIYMINEPGNPAFKLTWMLCILITPLVASLFYLYVKGDVGARSTGRRLETLRVETGPFLRQDPAVLHALKISKAADATLSTYMAKRIGYPTHMNTEVTYFPLGEDKFKELVKQLEHAREFIFMEYFIVEFGEVWGTVLDILERKAQQGVEVRFMYDGMCSISMLPFNYYRTLRKKGIKCKAFNQIRPMLSTVQNNRDHRKICVIDGKVGFTGGVNLGDEYINKKVRFGHWKDTAVMLRGDAVQNLTMLFLQMWNVSEKVPETFERYLTPMLQEDRPELGYVLPYGDSPYDHENVGEEVYFHILNHAKKYVHIMTPYLILDNGMMGTLTRAAKSGIEIQIIMPHIPDKWYAFVLAKTYYRELLESGVQIYEYTPGFVHAKVFTSDDETATVGTINLDYRSLYLHFECGVFMYHNPEVKNIERDFQDTLLKCQRVTITEVQRRPMSEKISGQVLRLIAPLM